MFKEMLAVTAAFIISAASVLPVYASSLSDVPVASGSNALWALSDKYEYHDDSYDIAPVSYVDVTNTIYWRGVKFYFATSDWIGLYTYRDSDNTGRMSASLPIGKVYNVQLQLFPNNFGQSGKYKVRWAFSSDISGPYAWSSAYSQGLTRYNNANKLYDNTPVNVYDDGAGGFYTDWSYVDTSGLSQLNLNVSLKKGQTLGNAFGGQFKVQFERVTDFPEGSDYVSNPSPTTSEDIQQDISNSVGDIASGVGDINSSLTMTNESLGGISSSLHVVEGALEDIIRTISLQLEALWNQMYNFMHVPQLANDDKNTDRIIDALEDIDVRINTDNSQIIANDNRLAQEQIENDNANADMMANGYDQSGMDADNDRLNDSLNEYADAENSVMDSVNDSLNDFEFSGSLDSYVSTISVISDFIQQMYESSGGFKDVINIGFMLSIAGMVIGLYRFKDG